MKKNVKTVLSIVSVITLVIIVNWIYKRYKKRGKRGMNLPKVFAHISDKYGNQIAENVERIFRLETDHFTSTGYVKTGAAGMLAFAPEYPYGFNSLKSFWDNNPEFAPTGIWEDKRGYKYLKFKDEGGFMTVAQVLLLRGNDPGRYFADDDHPDKQEEYRKAVENIKVRYL